MMMIKQITLHLSLLFLLFPSPPSMANVYFLGERHILKSQTITHRRQRHSQQGILRENTNTNNMHVYKPAHHLKRKNLVLLVFQQQQQLPKLVNNKRKVKLHLGVCILLRELDQVQGFASNKTISIVVYYFIQIICYMFRSYDHLQVESNMIISEVYISASRWSYDRNM
jgi:hypothetical protein